MMHWLWYGEGTLYESGPRHLRRRPQARCGADAMQTQLTSNERRVTCPRCLAIIHATEPEGPITQTSRKNPGVPEEGPVEHLKNAAAIIQANLELGENDVLVADDARAVLARIRQALRQLEHRRVNIPLSRRRNSRNVQHRSNPALAILGANPRVDDATIATWAKIEYMRPDDPDGKNIVRVHEFKDGFEIGWLSDGTVQLSHPKHPLWMEDE